MSRYFVNLTQGQPRNSLLDFSPVNQGLNAIGEAQQNATRNAMMRDDMQMRKDQFAATQARAQKQDARIERDDLGKAVLGVHRLPDGPQKDAAWQRVLGRFNVQGLNDQERNLQTGLPMLMAELGVTPDPMAEADRRLGMDVKRAQLAKLNREASGVAAKYGKTGSIFQGPDGAFYSVQFAEDGTKKIEPVAVDGTGLTPARGVMEVGDTLRDKSTGQVVTNIGQNLAAGEQAKDEGKAFAKFKEAFPKVQTGYQMYVNKSDRLLSTIDRALSRVGSSTAGFGALLSVLPASEARALQGDLDTIRANVGFEELQAMRDASPTGGALGQVSEMENRLLQSVRAAIDQYQKGENLAQNLGIIRQSVTQLRQLKEDAYKADLARFQGGGFRQQEQQTQPNAKDDLRKKYGLE